MNKLTRKCPNCGAMVPADVKYCRKCHARVDTGRIEVLDQPNRERSHPRKNDNDALRNLPKPVRPVEDDGYDDQYDNGYAAPAGAAGGKRKLFDRSGRSAESGGRSPRAMSTARGGDGAAYADSGSDKTLWQIIAVLGVILVIVIVAIILVIRLNRPADSANTSDPYKDAQVITSSTMAPSPTPNGTPEPESTPEGLIVPDATPVPSPRPTATPMPIVTAVPTAQPTPTPTAPPANNFNVTEASGTVKVVNSTGANLRSGPGDTYNVQATVGVNTQLTRTGTSGSWTRVNYNGQNLFIFTNLLDIGSGSSGGSSSSSSSGSNYTVTADSGTGTVTGNGVNIRSGPGTGYGVIGTASKGNTLTITGYSGSWYRVNYNGQNGFISSQYLSKGGSSSGGSTSSGTTGTVTGNGVNIRSGPGTGYSSIGSASKGATVTILGQSGDWYQIKYGNTTGYMSAQYVSKN